MTSKKGKKDNGVFHSKRRTPMLPIEAIERIRVLSECGKGSKAISALTGISRPTVRKYLTEIKSNKPISTKVARPSVLDPHKDQIHRWFLSCRGHCPALLRKIQSQLGIQISLRTLQKYCKPWRSQELSSVEKTERYEVPAGNEMQIDFGFDDILIGGVKTRVSFFVAVLSYSRRVFVKLYPQENQGKLPIVAV